MRQRDLTRLDRLEKLTGKAATANPTIDAGRLSTAALRELMNNRPELAALSDRTKRELAGAHL